MARRLAILNYTAKVLQGPPKQKYNHKNGCRVITTGQPSKKNALYYY